ncbi:MAG: bifunctional diaminohydroxyphosphoribosylaminopyrimidine deaminase/5-amino-6-(5-phosphoribosylamino)uracil reductase RibD [Phycisphaerales bacterium]|nr:bifunctional diaminohydroxyphosphoribosylaminopyrimidine deaminase/5-amino-6-(5-phosphoribosylamino)uracil reductase RibD [Phycisphaerales bacterium]
MSGTDTKRYLDRAALAALRGFGLVEPNPMVGAVIVRGDEAIGIGHHRVFGGLHAEREAIKNCRDRGFDPRGATLFCTLEPCCHHGKQPPCTEAVIDAGIARVVIAREDPAEISGGGSQILRDAGVEVERTSESPLAYGLCDPFVHRVRTGRPWVIAKWAQTLDGRIATRTGESKWISGVACRRRVHRLRGRVDAVLVGIGTAIADDPMLNPRDVRHVRREPARIVIDTHGRLPADSKLVRTARDIRTILVTTQGTSVDLPDVEVCRVAGDGLVDLEAALQAIGELGIATLLVEAGPRLLGSLVEADLVDEAIVHLAPGILGDAEALPVAVGREIAGLDGMRRYRLVRSRPVGDDVELHYRRRGQGLV